MKLNQVMRFHLMLLMMHFNTCQLLCHYKTTYYQITASNNGNGRTCVYKCILLGFASSLKPCEIPLMQVSSSPVSYDNSGRKHRAPRYVWKATVASRVTLTFEVRMCFQIDVFMPVEISICLVRTQLTICSVIGVNVFVCMNTVHDCVSISSVH